MQDTNKAPQGSTKGELEETAHKRRTEQQRRFFFVPMPCALQGSDGHLNVCGLVKKKPYWPKANAVQKKPGAIQANKNQQEQAQPQNKKQNQQHGCTQVTGEMVKRLEPRRPFGTNQGNSGPAAQPGLHCCPNIGSSRTSAFSFRRHTPSLVCHT